MSNVFRESVQMFESMDSHIVKSGKRKLNDEQAPIFRDIIGKYASGGKAFLHGQGGSGKSVLINALKKYCDANEITCAVTASTGKAASALGGVTIHSYIGLSMHENENAQSVEDAFKLSAKPKDMDFPDILIIDEASMIGESLLREITKVGFPYILFVGDTSQLRPVKDVQVDWNSYVSWSYYLHRNMRAQDADIVRVFDHFREHKEGSRTHINIRDYINGRNIIELDYADTKPLPKGTESCFIGYRNRLVEKFATRLKSEENTRFNLNVGINITKMIVEKGKEDLNKWGGYDRQFVQETAYYNGEDVDIVKLTDVTKKLVANKTARFGKWNLKLAKKGIIITDSTAPIEREANESKAPKFWISFPPEDVLEYTTLSVINGDTFALVWDGIESEFKEMEQFYFSELFPYLQKFQAIKTYFSKKRDEAKMHLLDADVRSAMTLMSRSEFMSWYELHDDTKFRKKGWTELYSAKSVVSARPSISRTTTKAQGISVPSIIICEDSFYGADKSAQYVAVSRARHGIIILKNVPDDWKNTDG